MGHNFESKAAKKLVEAFSHESFTEGVFTNQYDWEGVDTIRLRSVVSYPLTQYNWQDVTGASRFGPLIEVEDEIQPLTLSQDYAYNLAIDKRNNTSTLMEKAAGSIASRQIRERLIPQEDIYRLNAIATGYGVTGFGGAGGGTIKHNVTLTKTNALATIFGHGAEMSNLLVPKKNRVLFIGETASLNVKLADQIVGTGATVQNMAGQIIKSGELGTFNQMHIVEVPDTYLPAHCLYMIVLKDAVVAPTKIKTMRVLNEHPDIDGAVAQGRFLYDCFVIAKRANGILVAYDN